VKALILAAGYATRLYPLTRDYPKPLLLVNNRPIIDYIVYKLHSLKDIDEIIVVTNSKFISHFRKWKKGLHIKTRLSLVDDLTKTLAGRRGAIGDVYFTLNKKRINDDLLVIGGDNIFDKHLAGFMDFVEGHRAHHVIGAYDIKDKKEAANYGVIRLNRRSEVVDFKEKPSKPKSTLVGMCLYYFPRNKLQLIGEYMGDRKQNKDTTGGYISWLKDKAQIYGFVFKGAWYDIGDHKFYNKAKESFWA